MTTITTATDEAENIVRRITEAITGRADGLRIERVPTMGGGTRFILSVYRTEVGKVVGKAGCHIRALQAITEAIGELAGVTLRLTLEEPDDGDRAPAAPAREFDRAAYETLLRDVLGALCPSEFEITALDLSAKTTLEIKADWLIEDLRTGIDALFSSIARSMGVVVEIDFI